MLKDRVFSIIIIIFLIIMFLETYNFSVRLNWQLYNSAVYPRILLLLVGLLTVFLLIKSFIKGENKKINWKSFAKKYSIVAIVLFLTGLYITILPLIGFIWSTIFYLLIFRMILVSKLKVKEVIVSLIFSISTTLMIYLVFQVFLNVSLP